MAKYGKDVNAWFGHPARLTVNGAPPAAVPTTEPSVGEVAS